MFLNTGRMNQFQQYRGLFKNSMYVSAEVKK